MNSDLPILLIDGRNLLYRAIYANLANKSRGKHHFVVMMRFMRQLLELDPSAVMIFWDAPKNTLWRKKLYPPYKERTSKHRVDISEDLHKTQDIAKRMLDHIGVKQFYRDGQEADDLIYATCRTLYPKPIVIVSGDKDYQQVSWRMPGVKQFDALKNKMITTSDFDPVVAKSLAGDVSDNIEGYQGIGPVKSAAMARAISDRIEFLNTNGHSIYIRNLLLTDLSLCPDLLKNILYVHRELVVDAVHDKDKLFSMAEDLRVRGIITEYSDIILPFGHLLAKTTKQVVE